MSLSSGLRPLAWFHLADKNGRLPLLQGKFAKTPFPSCFRGTGVANPRLRPGAWKQAPPGNDGLVNIAGVIEGGIARQPKAMLPRTTLTRRTTRWRPGSASDSADGHEMSSLGDAIRCQKPCDQHVGIRPIELFAAEATIVGAIWKHPPLASSRIAAKTLGESKRGKQNQSIDPFSSNEAHRSGVTDNPIVFDWLIGHESPPSRCSSATTEREP